MEVQVAKTIHVGNWKSQSHQSHLPFLMWLITQHLSPSSIRAANSSDFPAGRFCLELRQVVVATFGCHIQSSPSTCCCAMICARPNKKMDNVTAPVSCHIPHNVKMAFLCRAMQRRQPAVVCRTLVPVGSGFRKRTMSTCPP